MSSLPDFLAQIGAAASLSTTKLVFSQEGLEGNLNAIHQRIEVEIQSVYVC